MAFDDLEVPSSGSGSKQQRISYDDLSEDLPDELPIDFLDFH